MSPCARRKRDSRGISQRVAKTSIVLTFTTPETCPVAVIVAAINCPSAWRTSAANAAPAGVSRTERVDRASNGTPSCSSSLDTARLTAPCETHSSSAALEKLRWRAAASKLGSVFSGGSRRRGMDNSEARFVSDAHGESTDFRLPPAPRPPYSRPAPSRGRA